MGMLTDFFGSLFGVGYVGVKLAQEGIEKVERLEDLEMIKRFAEKHTDPELEKRLWEQIEDPSQHEVIWQRIEKYRRTHTRETVWFPVELYDNISSKEGDYSTRKDRIYQRYGWDYIGNRRPIIVDTGAVTQYQLTMHKHQTLGWLVFTYQKIPLSYFSGVAPTIQRPDIIKYLRKNRKKYGI